MKKYTLNDGFLDDPATFGEGHAYFLGWLYSDGNVHPTRNQLRFYLAEEDRAVLESLSRLVTFTGPIRLQTRKPSSVLGQPTRQHQHRVCLELTSRRLCSRAVELGIHRKSEDAPFPPYLQASLWPAFLRGLYEGDGTFSLASSGEAETNLVVNPVLARGVEKRLREALQIHVRVGTKFNNGSVTLRTAGSAATTRLLTWLYRDAQYWLPRKVAVFERLLTQRTSIRLSDNAAHALADAQDVVVHLRHLSHAA